MDTYFTAAMTTGLAFLLNRALTRLLGARVIVSYSPVAEELCKTLLPYMLGTDILLNHACFGLVEAMWDYWHSPRRGLGAAVFSVATHTVFGLVTVQVMAFVNNVAIGILAGILLHWLWNIIILMRSTRRTGMK